MKFLPLVKGEFIKIPKYQLLLWTAVLAIIPVTVAIVAYLKGYETFASQGLGDSSGLFMYYHFVNNYCVVILSALLWFFIYSKENTYNTWSILLTKIPYTFPILNAKSITFFVYYVFFVSLSHLLLWVICFIQGIEFVPGFFMASLFISLFITLSIGFLQLILHVVIQNGLIASTLSMIWIVLLLLYGHFPDVVQSVFPLFLSTTVIETSALTNLLSILLFAIGSGLFIGVTVSLLAMKSLFQME